MKTLSYVALMASVLTTGVAALACPDLSGSYLCPAQDGGNATGVVVSQNVQIGTTVYTLVTTDLATKKVTTTSYIADGVVRNINEGAEVLPEAFACEGNDDVRMDSTFTDPQAGKIVLLERYALDAKNNLTMTVNATVAGTTQPTTNETCTRQ